ncbi:HORMA domain-containing protein [Cladochytrium replicatum]|nr:HORMA domain-containing protein [Cladochytrium replicatum]
MATLQKSRSITLRGSAQIVAEYFDYAINSILYQRAIYPSEDFNLVKRYGLNLLVSSDESVRAYLKQILAQVERWLLAKAINKLVMVITSRETREVLERWQFDIILETEADLTGNPKSAEQKKDKSEKEIQGEIAAILRQVTASITFLPELEPSTFNILAYTQGNAEVPATWVDSDPRDIVNAERVRLRSFATGVHRVDTMVSYRTDESAGAA